MYRIIFYIKNIIFQLVAFCEIEIKVQELCLYNCVPSKASPSHATTSHNDVRLPSNSQASNNTYIENKQQ